jgi:hypothetical protein
LALETHRPVGLRGLLDGLSRALQALLRLVGVAEAVVGQGQEQEIVNRPPGAA